MLHNVEVRTTGGRGVVKLDDREVYGIQGLRFSAESGDLSTLTLDLIVIEDAVVADETCHVLIPDGTRDTLIALGWTPPDGA